MSPTTRPGYKQTDVGTIPEDWDVRAVCEMGDVLTGKALAVAAPGKPRPYLRTKNVFDGRIDVDDVLSMPMTDAEFDHFETKENDLLLNEGQSLELVGRCARYRGEYGHPVAIQNQLIRFRANTGTCPLFAEQRFRHCQHTGVFARIALKTTSIAHLGGKRFGALRLAWPCDVVEQKRIGTALADADAEVAHTVTLIAKQRSLKQAAMQELIGGNSRLSGHSENWTELPIGQIADVKTGPFGSALHESDYVEEGTPIITVEHLGTHGVEHCNLPLVSDSDKHRLSAYSLAPGDIVFSRVGSVDRSALIRPPESGWLFSGRLLRLRCDRQQAHPEYISHLFHSDSFKHSVRSVAVGQTMASLNTQILKSVRVTLPPFEEQIAIARVLSDMDAEIAALERQRDKTKQLKQAMMQELLTGKTRLV